MTHSLEELQMRTLHCSDLLYDFLQLSLLPISAVLLSYVYINCWMFWGHMFLDIGYLWGSICSGTVFASIVYRFWEGFWFHFWCLCWYLVSVRARNLLNLQRHMILQWIWLLLLVRKAQLLMTSMFFPIPILALILNEFWHRLCLPFGTLSV